MGFCVNTQVFSLHSRTPFLSFMGFVSQRTIGRRRASKAGKRRARIRNGTTMTTTTMMTTKFLRTWKGKFWKIFRESLTSTFPRERRPTSVSCCCPSTIPSHSHKENNTRTYSRLPRTHAWTYTIYTHKHAHANTRAFTLSTLDSVHIFSHFSACNQRIFEGLERGSEQRI